MCIEAFVFPMVAEAELTKYGVLSLKPPAKSIQVCRNALPIPQSLLTNAAVNVAGEFPTMLGMLSEVNGKEYEPNRIIHMPLARLEHGSLQWIEAGRVRVGNSRSEP